MFNLLTWFQLNFKEHTKMMKKITHHFDEDNLNSYHLEGSIWTHTMLVYMRALMFSNKNEVHIAALLHDLGKPYTMERNEDNKKVSFYSHEQVSTFLAIEVLNKLEKDVPNYKFNKIKVLKLINWHSDFHKFMELEIKEYGLLRKKDIVFLREKYLFENLFEDMYALNRADSYGRFMKEENIEYKEKMFKKIKEEYEDRVKYTNNEKENYNKNKKLLTILTGMPNSGKSSYLNNIDKDTIVISTDKYIEELHPDKSYDEIYSLLKDEDFKEIDKKLNKEFIKAVRSDKNIIIDRTNMSKKSRRRWNVSKKKYEVKIVCFLIEEKELKKRNEKRKKEGKTISDETMFMMSKRLSVPGYDETNNIEYIFN